MGTPAREHLSDDPQTPLGLYRRRRHHAPHHALPPRPIPRLPRLGSLSRELSTRTDIESEAFAGEGIHIDDLQAGDNIEVIWLPNRRCVFRYEGNAHFLVTVAENAKLHVGDRFETASFIIGKPLYIDRLIRGNEPPTAYVAGARNGLLKVERMND